MSQNPPVGAQKANVIFAIDLDRLWATYTDLLTRRVPEEG